jgi:Uma2 family endonuclease
MTLVSPQPHPQTPQAQFTVEQFHRLCEAVPEQRLELIAGEVLAVIAKGTRHSVLVNQLNQLITLWLNDQADCTWELRVESPLRLGEHDEPEPDLAVVRQRSHRYLSAHPTAADTILVIEVAGSSLRFDLEAKGRLYANAGIDAYWVVDVGPPQLITVLSGDSPDPRLEALRHQVEQRLASIPAAQG